jgi:hypothetical protein
MGLSLGQPPCPWLWVVRPITFLISLSLSLFLLPLGMTIIYFFNIHLYIYKDVGKLVPLYP